MQSFPLTIFVFVVGLTLLIAGALAAIFGVWLTYIGFLASDLSMVDPSIDTRMVYGVGLILLSGIYLGVLGMAREASGSLDERIWNFQYAVRQTSEERFHQLGQIERNLDGINSLLEEIRGELAVLTDGKRTPYSPD